MGFKTEIEMEEWLDLFEEDYELDKYDTDEIDVIMVVEYVIETIVRHIDKVAITVVIEDDLETFLNEYPTERYFIERGQADFDVTALNEALLNMRYEEYPTEIQGQIDDAVADERGSTSDPREADVRVMYRGYVTYEVMADLYARDYVRHSQIPLDVYLRRPQTIEAVIEGGKLKVDVIVEE